MLQLTRIHSTNKERIGVTCLSCFTFGLIPNVRPPSRNTPGNVVYLRPIQQTRRTPQLRHETTERNDTFPKNLGGVSDLENTLKNTGDRLRQQRRHWRGGLCHDLGNQIILHDALDIRQPILASLMPIRQPLVIQPHEVQ